MSQLIRELIEVPERVHAGDFVLKLTEGVAHPEETLRHYVVTEQLAEAFDQALGFIRSAIEAGSSKAAYLHGSFGSGKSHFMAVLHLLLQRNAQARSLEGLEAAVTAHDGWIQGKKFLLVPYHMIGQASLESAVLGGYVDRVQQLHPDKPIPPVYRAEGLFENARALRKELGDDAFFRRLNEGAGGAAGGGWGDLGTTWDATSFEEAIAAAPGSERRGALVSTLVDTFFTAYKDVARGGRESFESLDLGLSLISQHAKALGYDALVLFLDELILWLATHAGDRNFLSTESAKVSKLVEASAAERPVPIVSFVARQRDLRELIGPAATGADELIFEDVLSYWRGRFAQITLEDRNLTEIASRRVLRPRSPEAKATIDRAFTETEPVRERVREILLTPHGDSGMFRKVYPFSPAVVEALVAVSSALQRERTALRVMLQLLVSQRETLELGEIVPVGDLWDVIAEGDAPFTEGMRLAFENAKRLYVQKLEPMLEREHELTREQLRRLDYDDPKAKAFRADDRVLKTLLLGALVPEVEVLKGLSAERLAALNHGSYRTPIPGTEGGQVLQRCQRWASRVGEIKLEGDPANPTISVQLSGVDTESIIENAKVADNEGNRVRKIRELVFEALGIEDRDDMFLEHEITWRGTRRRFEVIFRNVREHNDESLATRGSQRKVLIDFPFDKPGMGPSDDEARLATFRAEGRPARTFAWLPAFLSQESRRELGRLVILDYVLAGDRFGDYARHLPSAERDVARTLLRNQRDALRERLRGVLHGAYGVEKATPGTLDEAHAPSSPFQSLDPAFAPRPPVGADLRQAFEHLLAQMLEAQFPAHPHFGQETKLTNLRKVRDEVKRAVEEPTHRIEVEKPLRSLMREIALPLRLGEMGEAHFVLGQHWVDHFRRHVSEPITVAKLRAAMDEPKAMGLPDAAQNLVIELYAEQTNRTFLLHGGSVRPQLESMPNELELREEPLPEQAAWETAIERAGKIFGIPVRRLRSAANVAELAGRLEDKIRPRLDHLTGLVSELEPRCEAFGVEGERARRLRTARAVLLLGREILAAEGKARVEKLASGEVETSADAMGASFARAEELRRALAGAKWQLIEGGVAQPGGEAIRERLADALAADEYAVDLAEALDAADKAATRILTRGAGPGTPPPAPAPEGEVVDRGGQTGLDAAGLEETARALRQRLADDPSLRATLSWQLVRRRGDG